MKRVAILLLCALLLSSPALAVDTDGLEEAMPDAAREIFGDITVRDFFSGADVFDRLWEHTVSMGKEYITAATKSALTVLVVTLLCSVAGAASSDGKTPGYVLLGGALAIFGVCAGEMDSFLRQVGDALSELQDFSRALLPCIAASSAAVGHGASGAARYTVSALFLDVLMTAGRDLVLPMIAAFAAVSTADAALPDGALGGPARLMSWLCTTFLTALTTIFTLCLTISGVIAGNADKLTGSVAKTAITAALPVVGKIAADAADVYLAGGKVLRGAIGVFGLAAVLGVCLGPLLALGVQYILFKAAAGVCEPFSDGRLAKLVGNMASCFGMALGLLGSAGLMLFISIVLGTEALTG